jgi:DNA-binding beta-propeller fold protein YncE
LVESLGRPRGLARLLDGRVVVSDRTRHTISILNLADRGLTLLAGSGVAGLADGRGTGAQFNEPYGITVLPDGNMLVADSANHLIRKVTLEGDVTVFAGDGNPGMKDDANKFLARFDFPFDVAVDAIGNAFISDVNNHRIRRISSAGAVETVAGDGIKGFADGNGATAQFYGQEQLDVTPDGKAVYVSDGNGGEYTAFHRIRRIRIP